MIWELIVAISHIIFWTVIIILLILLGKRRMDTQKNEKFEKREN